MPAKPAINKTTKSLVLKVISSASERFKAAQRPRSPAAPDYTQRRRNQTTLVTSALARLRCNELLCRPTVQVATVRASA